MNKRNYIFLILVIAFVVAVSGCTSSDTSSDTGSDTGSDTNTDSSDAKWHSVANFSGSGDKDTSTFTIKGDKFKVKVTANTESSEYAMWTFFAYPEGETALYEGDGSIDTFNANTETDEFEVTADPGNYYLSVLSANLESWEVEIFDYY